MQACERCVSASFEEASYCSNVQHKSTCENSIAISASSSTVGYDDAAPAAANSSSEGAAGGAAGVGVGPAGSPTPGNAPHHPPHHQQQQQHELVGSDGGSSENALQGAKEGGGGAAAALQPVGHSSSRELAFWPELMTLTEVLARSRHTAVYTAEYNGQTLALKVGCRV
jgi:hypothetical protein